MRNKHEASLDWYKFKAYVTFENFEYSTYSGPGKDDFLYNNSYFNTEVFYQDRLIKPEQYYFLYKYIVLPHEVCDTDRGYLSLWGSYIKITQLSKEISRKMNIGLPKMIKRFAESSLVNDLNETTKYIFKKMERFDYDSELFDEYFDLFVKSIPKIKIFTGAGSEINEERLESLYSFVLQGGQVNPDTLKKNLQNSTISIVKHEEKIVAICAIKNPTKEYIEGIFRKAGYCIDSQEDTALIKNYKNELGYCFVIPEYRGLGIMDYLVHTRCVRESNLFATSGDKRMIEILKQKNFQKVGNTWKGNYNKELNLFLFNNKIASEYELIDNITKRIQQFSFAGGIDKSKDKI